jgi:hypothetical protein
MTQSCSECGKSFRNGSRAVAIMTGTIDYKNCQGFNDDGNGYVALLCRKCTKENNFLPLKKW